MAGARKIVVESLIPAPVERVWALTQDPDLHVRWDIRFDTIRYLDGVNERGYQRMGYRTRLGFGIDVQGFGAYLHSEPLRLSSFEFDSEDRLSLIANGRGIWLYERRDDGTFFKTVFDYEVRLGWFGRAVDALLFRPLMQLATEWGFETLRRWAGGDEGALRRRSRWRFLPFLFVRRLGKSPAPGAARSWLGTGQEAEGRAR